MNPYAHLARGAYSNAEVMESLGQAGWQPNHNQGGYRAPQEGQIGALGQSPYAMPGDNILGGALEQPKAPVLQFQDPVTDARQYAAKNPGLNQYLQCRPGERILDVRVGEGQVLGTRTLNEENNYGQEGCVGEKYGFHTRNRHYCPICGWHGDLMGPGTGGGDGYQSLNAQRVLTGGEGYLPTYEERSYEEQLYGNTYDPQYGYDGSGKDDFGAQGGFSESGLGGGQGWNPFSTMAKDAPGQSDGGVCRPFNKGGGKGKQRAKGKGMLGAKGFGKGKGGPMGMGMMGGVTYDYSMMAGPGDLVDVEMKVPREMVSQVMSDYGMFTTSQRPVIAIEKTVDNPITVVKESERIVPKPEIIERIIEVPRTEIVHKTTQGPSQVLYQEQIVEVPQVVVEERVVHVPKREIQERLIEIPKVEFVERIEYDDQIEYREVPVDKIVEVPEIEYRVREVEQFVPQTYIQEYYVDKYTEIPLVQYQDVSRNEQAPALAQQAYAPQYGQQAQAPRLAASQVMGSQQFPQGSYAQAPAADYGNVMASYASYDPYEPRKPAQILPQVPAY